MARVGRGLSIRGHFSTRLSARQMFSHGYITVLNVCLTRLGSYLSGGGFSPEHRTHAQFSIMATCLEVSELQTPTMVK